MGNLVVFIEAFGYEISDYFHAILAEDLELRSSMNHHLW